MAWIEDANYLASDFNLKISRWDFPDSGISCVFGESGSGKTTLLQIMAGLIPSQHRLCVKGEILSDLPVKFRNIGFVFQDFALFPHMTVSENIVFATQAKKLDQVLWQEHYERLLKRLDLQKITQQKSSTLSGGEAQRVALARALVTKPKIVLMDEPFSSLDENRRDEARNLVLELSSELEVPFILVTHDMRDVRLLSQNILLLRNGHVVGQGVTGDLLNRPQSLEIARALPENQIIEIKNISDFSQSPILQHQGFGHFLVEKPWNLKLQRETGNSKIKGEILRVIDEGPWQVALVRLSSGQIIRAMAPLGEVLGGQVELTYDPKNIILFKGQ